MFGPAVDLEPVPASTPVLLGQAQALAVTGFPVLGNPARDAHLYTGPSRAVLLATTPAGQRVGVVAWTRADRPGGIPVGRVVSLAVHRGVRPDQVQTVTEFLVHCATVQLEAELVAAGRAGGYMVADVPKISPAATAFAAVGWSGVQQPAGSPTDRYVYFLETDDASLPNQPDDGSW